MAVIASPGLIAMRGTEHLHPLHAILLGFAFPLFSAALICDFAYGATFQIQWANFSSWLIAGGLFIAAITLLWALLNGFRGSPDSKLRRTLYFLVLLAMWMSGFVNALVHSRDAWATMPEGLYLSAVTSLFALFASWIGHSGFPAGDVK